MCIPEIIEDNEQSLLAQEWEALQNVPSYVERIQHNPGLFDSEEQQEARQEYADALRILRWN